VIFKIDHLLLLRVGASPDLLSTDCLVGTRRALGAWLAQIPSSILGTFQFFFLFMGLKVVLKKDWLATLAFVGIFATAKSLGSSHLAIDAVTAVLVYGILALIVYRFGLVPLACAIFTVDMLANVPFTGDISAWYFGMTMFALLSVIGLAVWGFYHSLGGQQAWEANLR